MKQIKKSQGLKGLYRGLTASAARDIPGWAVYFWAYEWLKQKGEQIDSKYPLTD